MRMQVALKVIEGKQTGTLIPLNREKFLIGREEDCQLRPNSDLVSRHHCVIAIDDFTVRIRDLGSTNGTFVNDQRITTQIVLKQGDTIRIGKLAFEIQIQVQAEAKPAPAAEVVPEPVAIDYTQTGAPSGSETVADFAIPRALLDETINEKAQMSGDTTVINPVAPAANGAKPRPVAPPVRLPDPSEFATHAAATPGAAPTGSAPSKSNNPAADIIRQYMQRRPGS